MENRDIIFFAQTTFRNQQRKFGIKTDDRRKHMYIVGKTGMGKTELLKNLAIQDIKKGNGLAFIDPHGEAAEDLLDFIPEERISDVIYFNPADIEYPVSFNVMENVSPEQRHLVASGLMGVFKKIWPDVWSARMEYILNNTILALLEIPDSTLLGINMMLSDINYREYVVSKISDPVVKSFWVNEFSRYTQRYEVEATAAIQNKVGQFISNPLIRNIVGQLETSFNIREAMDQSKILIANLSKGKIGEDNSMLLGALLITKIQLSAMSRVSIPEESRKDFYLYVDEFQNFATESFINILSEARKYHLNLILAHQYIDQMPESVRKAIFGNIGTLICFRVGAIDAEYLEKEFLPEFTANDLINLSKYNIYLKLMIDGISSSPFSAKTLPPFEKPRISFKNKIIEFSRAKYAKKREEVENRIKDLLSERKESKSNKKQELYDATCHLCGKPIKVPFLPDPSRPVYCKDCLKKITGQKSFTLDDLVKAKPISFKKEKQEREKSKDFEELQDLLEKALSPKDKEKKTRKSKKKVNSKEKNKEREIKPGQSIEF